MNILVTGGAGFIGSALVRYIINNTNNSVINVDKLTYAGNLKSLESVSENDRYFFEKVDICDQLELKRIFNKHQPDAVMHLAAESHVDRSIDSSVEFIQTNIVGTYNLLEVSRVYWLELKKTQKVNFRFHHISTDEVFGDLDLQEEPFTESTPYNPSSPYSATKASSDHLVRAWQRTHKLPTLITNCSNNYGPYQFPEKLVPLMIMNAICGKPLPIYGQGNQVRDWLFVEDHALALYQVLMYGDEGQTYNIGGRNEKTNLEVVFKICDLLDEMRPKSNGSYRDQIIHIEDRPGHDKRYAINSKKITNDIGWIPTETFETGIRKTIIWYLKSLEKN